MKNLYVVVDTELGKKHSPFFAEDDRSAERQFMLMLQSADPIVRPCLNIQLVAMFNDDFDLFPLPPARDHRVVAEGVNYDEWLKAHKKEVSA